MDHSESGSLLNNHCILVVVTLNKISPSNYIKFKLYMIRVKMPWVAMTEVAVGKVSCNYHHANHASVNRIYEGSSRAINCLLLDIKIQLFNSFLIS